MTTPTQLMGLGLPVLVAARVGSHLISVTAAGGSVGSAAQLYGPNAVVYCNSTNSGNFVALPQLAGDVNQSNPTDRMVVANLLGAAIVVGAANNGQGSAVTLYTQGASTAGTTGVSVSAGAFYEFIAISASSWIGIRTA